MNPGELQAIESQRQALLGQLTAAETALRAGLNNTRGFGDTARAHMEPHVEGTMSYESRLLVVTLRAAWFNFRGWNKRR